MKPIARLIWMKAMLRSFWLLVTGLELYTIHLFPIYSSSSPKIDQRDLWTDIADNRECGKFSGEGSGGNFTCVIMVGVVTRPVKETQRFPEKSNFSPGEKRQVAFELSANWTSHLGCGTALHHRTREYQVWIGPNSKRGG